MFLKYLKQCEPGVEVTCMFYFSALDCRGYSMTKKDPTALIKPSLAPLKYASVEFKYPDFILQQPVVYCQLFFFSFFFANKSSNHQKRSCHCDNTNKNVLDVSQCYFSFTHNVVLIPASFQKDAPYMEGGVVHAISSLHMLVCVHICVCVFYPGIQTRQTSCIWNIWNIRSYWIHK